MTRRMITELKDTRIHEPPARLVVIGDETRLSHAFVELARNVRRHSGVDSLSVNMQDFGYRVDICLLGPRQGLPTD